MSTTNLYENINANEYSNVLAIETAILQHDIILPELPKEELNLRLLQEYYREDINKTYKFAEQEYEDTVGNFYISVLFPLVEDGDSSELKFKAPSTKNIICDGFTTKGYTERNFIPLTIPKYILMNFRDKVPKGTKFLVGFTGGNSNIENISIIGISGRNFK